MPSVKEIVLETLSLVAPNLTGPDRDKAFIAIERLIPDALRSVSLDLSRGSDSNLRALTTRYFNVTPDGQGMADLTSLLSQSDRALLMSIPFVKVTGNVLLGELFFVADRQLLDTRDLDEGTTFYTVEAQTIYTRPAVTSQIKILAPHVLDLATLNPILRSFLIESLVAAFREAMS